MKIYSFLGGAAACCAAAILLLGGNGLARVVKASINPDPVPGDTPTPTGIHFYNDDVQNDGIDTNNYNFGPSAYGDVTSGKYAHLYDELLDRMDGNGQDDQKLCDPNLIAATAYAIDLTRGTTILKETKDAKLKLGEKPNVAAERLLKSEKDRQDVYDELKKQFESATSVTIEDLSDYTSQMYQIPTGKYFTDRPAITVKNTQHEGGHVLVFKWDDGTTVKYRLECGYQPTDVPEWNPPSNDNPPPPTTTNPPTTTPPTETTPPSVTEPPTTTTLEPKKATEAPPVQDDPDIGGEVRSSDINTTPTPEPDISDLPSSYIPPQPPTEEPKSTTTRKTVDTQEEPVTQPPVVTQPPQVTHDDKTYTVAPPQVTNPPLEDVNDDAPTVPGNSGGVQTGTVPADALDRFG
jgi:hypothetical protein